MTHLVPPFPTRRSTNPAAPGLLRRLHREWERMRTDPDALRRAQCWEIGVHVRTLDDVLVAVGWFPSAAERCAAGGTTAESADRALRTLVVAARCDELAARVVLQRLLPGLVQQARRWSVRSDGSPSALEELLASAWVAVRTYRVEHRSGAVAPSLLSDAVYHAFVRQGRRRATHEPQPHEHFERLVDERWWSSCDELHDLLASVLGAGRSPFTATDRRLLGLLLSGCGPDEMAAALGVSVRTVTNRRHDLVDRLRAAVLADAA